MRSWSIRRCPHRVQYWLSDSDAKRSLGDPAGSVVIADPTLGAWNATNGPMRAGSVLRVTRRPRAYPGWTTNATRPDAGSQWTCIDDSRDLPSLNLALRKRGEGPMKPSRPPSSSHKGDQ
jgi:hypothetical protein